MFGKGSRDRESLEKLNFGITNDVSHFPRKHFKLERLHSPTLVLIMKLRILFKTKSQQNNTPLFLILIYFSVNASRKLLSQTKTALQSPLEVQR